MEGKSHSFPASYGLQLVDLAARWSVAPEALLAPFSLTHEELAQPGARLDVDTLVALTERTRALTGEPGIGVYLGLHKHLSSYGFVGFASMNAATVGEAMQQAVEFAKAVSTGLDLSLRVEGDTAALVLHEYVDVGSIRDVAQLSFFVGLRQLTRELTGRQGRTVVELSIPEPDYFARFHDVLPGARFGQPAAQVLFHAAALEYPLPRPDRAALNLAREQCQAQLAQLGFDSSLAGQVRRALVEGERFRGVEQVAAALHVSARTLKRRLAEQGTSFSELLQEERRLRALQLLRDAELSIEQIAERLGYSSASTFSRSFQRWTGETPAAHRRNLPNAGLLAGR